jgi:hypothetical protein
LYAEPNINDEEIVGNCIFADGERLLLKLVEGSAQDSSDKDDNNSSNNDDNDYNSDDDNDDNNDDQPGDNDPRHDAFLPRQDALRNSVVYRSGLNANGEHTEHIEEIMRELNRSVNQLDHSAATSSNQPPIHHGHDVPRSYQPRIPVRVRSWELGLIFPGRQPISATATTTQSTVSPITTKTTTPATPATQMRLHIRKRNADLNGIVGPAGGSWQRVPPASFEESHSTSSQRGADGGARQQGRSGDRGGLGVGVF